MAIPDLNTGQQLTLQRKNKCGYNTQREEGECPKRRTEYSQQIQSGSRPGTGLDVDYYCV